MSVLIFFWKVWFRLNLLTKDIDNDYIAEVSTVGNTKRNEDIAREIVEERSEIKFDTLLSVLSQRDRIVRRMVQQGNSVLDGCVKISPRVSGSWIGTNAKFDPAIHKITVDTTPSAEMRAALAEVGVEVLGVKDNGSFIGLVTDTSTGLSDGSITAGDDIMIEGDRLKIAPEGEEGLGVFFVNDAGEATPVTRRLTQNDPKKLIARVPALPAGAYTLRVVTRFTSASNLLKEPRVIEYEQPLVVA
jgi:hypothetical protein